jgi:hypothetical protein
MLNTNAGHESGGDVCAARRAVLEVLRIEKPDIGTDQAQFVGCVSDVGGSCLRETWQGIRGETFPYPTCELSL